MLLTTVLFWAYKYFIKRWATHFQDVTLVSLERNYTKVLRFALTGRTPYFSYSAPLDSYSPPLLF